MNATRTRRAAIYVRVSTDRQTVENQVAKLTEVAKARGWQIVATFTDAGISGVKGRKDRPGLDDMLKQAQRGTFDVVMAWAIDRVGRSLIDLLGTIQHLEACHVDLYLDQQTDRHDDARGPIAIPGDRGFRGVRALNDPRARQRWARQGQGRRQDARSSEER